MLYPVFRPQKARVVFKFGSQSDGCWNHELFIAQVKKQLALLSLNIQYPITP